MSHVGGPEFHPRCDAVLVVPATVNAINKWALGINDTLALGLLNEAIGRWVPTTVVPIVNSAFASHSTYQRARANLSTIPIEIAGSARNGGREIALRGG